MRWGTALLGIWALGAGCTLVFQQPEEPDNGHDLVEEGLLVRYFIEEARAGQGSGQLRDFGPAEFDLNIIVYEHEEGEQPFFVEEEEGRRGLRWTEVGANGSARGLLLGTMLADLHGATAATIEMVLALDGVSDDGSRLLSIDGGSGAPSLFTLSSRDPERVLFGMNGESTVGQWAIEPGVRQVLHLVLDTERSLVSDQLMLYINGAELENIGTAPAHGTSIDLLVEDEERHAQIRFVLGNQRAGAASMAGTIHYAAIYGRALSDGEVRRNHGILIERDDRP